MRMVNPPCIKCANYTNNRQIVKVDGRDITGVYAVAPVCTHPEMKQNYSCFKPKN